MNKSTKTLPIFFLLLFLTGCTKHTFICNNDNYNELFISKNYKLDSASLYVDIESLNTNTNCKGYIYSAASQRNTKINDVLFTGTLKCSDGRLLRLVELQNVNSSTPIALSSISSIPNLLLKGKDQYNNTYTFEYANEKTYDEKTFKLKRANLAKPKFVLIKK